MKKTIVLRLGVSPTVKLPDDADRVQQLRNKLQEYKQRPSEEARYKSLVLERILKETEVSTVELASYVEAEVGQPFNRFLFYECCNVIDDYCKSGGSRTILGSGLPQSEWSATPRAR